MPSIDRAASDASNTQNVLNVNVVLAERVESTLSTHTCFGTLKPTRSSSLGFARGGQILEIIAGVGDAIQAGEQLSSLEQKQLENQRERIAEALRAANKNVENLESNVNAESLQQQIVQEKQRVSRLTDQLDDLDLELAKGLIKAPYDGYVSEVSANLGDSVPAGRPIYRVISNQDPVVSADVAAPIARQLSVGRAVRIIKNQQRFDGELTTKSPELNKTSPTQRLEFSIKDADMGVKLTYGATVEVRFSIPTEESGFWLPNSALQRGSNGLWCAFVVANDGDREVVERRILELVQLQDDATLVRGALASGDRVIANGLHRIVPGQTVLSREIEKEETASGENGAGE